VRDGFSISDCQDCRVASTIPPVPQSEIARYYPPTYYGAKNRRFHPLLERLVAFFRWRRVRRIERYVTGGRILDVGTGRGIFPGLMRERGWDAHGTEISEVAAQGALESRLPVFIGDFLDAPYAPGSFDVVVLWHVLEHIRDGHAALAKCHELVRPGGLLVIAVPNFESLQAALAGPLWFHLDVPRHYFHFRLSALRTILADHGFRTVETAHFSAEQNLYGWIQSLLNLLGFRTNLLYDHLKTASAREASPTRLHPVQTLLLAVALVPVVPLSVLLFGLETLLRRGGTIELYTIREG
jgi:2-polyprenyl-3-methyl-5-hydroxy-6-metoxy-1,4-benzoquinol methylase